MDYLSVAQYYESRNADNSKFLGKLLLVVNVDLANEYITSLLGYLINDGGKHTAGTAPICIEVEKYNLFALLDVTYIQLINL